MTLDDLEIWRVIHSQFVSADSKSGISFALKMSLRLRIAAKLEKNNGRNGQRKQPMARVTLSDLDPGATVYGF